MVHVLVDAPAPLSLFHLGPLMELADVKTLKLLARTLPVNPINSAYNLMLHLAHDLDRLLANGRRKAAAGLSVYNGLLGLLVLLVVLLNVTRQERLFCNGTTLSIYFRRAKAIEHLRVQLLSLCQYVALGGSLPRAFSRVQLSLATDAMLSCP